MSLSQACSGPTPGIVEARPRSNGPRGSARRRPSADRCGCRAARPACRPPCEAAWASVSSPWPAASTPKISTSGSSRKGWNSPMALEPPPMQATSESGSRPSAAMHLLARLGADDRLEVAHHGRIGMRAGGGADAIERVVDVGDPVAQRLVHGVLEGLGAGLHRARPRRPASSCGTRWASAARRRPRPCRRRRAGRSARRRWRSRRRAGRRRSRR